MGLVLLPFLRLQSVRPEWKRGTLGLLAASAVCDLLNVVTFFAAMHVTSVGVAALTHYFAPILVALFAPLVGEGRLPRAVPWALTASLGLALVLEPWRSPAEGLFLGASLGLISAFGYAANTLVLRRLAFRVGTLRAVAYHGLLAAALLSPFADWGSFVAAERGPLAWLLFGALLLAGGGSVLFTQGLKALGSTRATMLAYLEPLVAVIVGIAAWGERHSPLSLLGGALILLAGLRVSTRRVS